MRECAFEVVAEAIRAEDDYTRIALLLVLESTGDVFFKGIFHFCDRVGVEESLDYFSRPHWEVEAGHDIFKPESQSQLFSIVVDEAARARILPAVERLFSSLTALVDHLHACILNGRNEGAAQARST